jgi:hypothetical protein
MLAIMDHVRRTYRAGWQQLMRAPAAAIAAALLLCGSLIAAACASTAESPEHTPAPAATPTSATRSTGIAALDAIIAAAVRGDTAALQAAIQYTPTACVTTQEGIGAPPLCRAGEADGTKVDVIPLAQCEGFFARADEWRLDAGAASLYGVYRASAAEQFPPGKYWAIFGRSDANNPSPAFAIVMNDDHIVGIHFGCAMKPAQMVEFERLTDVVVAPPP